MDTQAHTSKGNRDLHEFRCTRNSPYMHECIGRDNIGARQGHYIYATDERGAMEQMADEYPTDRYGFTAELAKPNWGCTVCRKWRGLCRC